MPTLNDLVAKLKQLEDEIVRQGPSIAEEMAITQLSMARERIQRKGIPGRSYSTKPMLATESMFSIKAKFKPTVIGTEIGRDSEGRLVRGGVRNRSGAISRKKTRPRWLWITFKGAKKGVPVMVLPGGYKELRQLNGRQTGYVDLSYFGRMWQNTKLVDRKAAGFKFQAIIGATQKEEKGKLAGNRKRYGPFLDPTPDDIKILQQIQRRRIREIFQKVLG